MTVVRPVKPRLHAGSTASQRMARSGGGLEAPPSMDGARGHLPAAARTAHNLDVVQAERYQLPVGILEADLGDLALVEGALEAGNGDAELRVVALPLHRRQAAGLERAAVLLIVVVARAHLRMHPLFKNMPT